MQECFRKYPEIYGSELTDDPADEEAGSAQPEGDVQALREAHPESAAQVPWSPERHAKRMRIGMPCASILIRSI